MKKVIATLLIALLIVAGGLYTQRERVLISIGSYLVSEDPLTQVDAIAVLSGGVPYRILEGIDTYRLGLAPRILLTPLDGGRAYREMMLSLGVKYETEVELNRRIAIHRGVPAKAIEILPPVGSTKNEAEVILAYLRAKKLRSLIVITSKYHSTRTRLIFRSLNGEGVKIAVRPSRYDKFNPRAWWRSRGQSKKVLYEYVKLINHYTFEF